MLAHFFTSLVRASAIVFLGILAFVAFGLACEFLPLNVHLAIGFVSLLGFLVLAWPAMRTMIDPQDVSIIDLIVFVVWFIKGPFLLLGLWPLAWVVYLLAPEISIPPEPQFSGVEFFPAPGPHSLLSRRNRLRAFSGLCLLLVLLLGVLPSPGKPGKGGRTLSAEQDTRQPLKPLPTRGDSPVPFRLHR